jgi:ABC-type Mn2+/Zn2+ transport system permease subunit
VLAAVFGLSGGVAGLLVSYYANSASGASIVLVTAAIFAVCFLIGRRRVRLVTP